MIKLPSHNRAGAVALAVVLLAGLVAGAAHANPTQLSIMQDDTQVVAGNPTHRLARLKEMKALGADIVKVRLSWGGIAPGRGRRKPRFDATDPNAYPIRGWAPYDDVVNQATRLGLRVYMELGGSAPPWATRGGRVSNPSAAEFGKFVKAAGRRYSGAFGNLPRVSLWAVWNEPNLVSWLAPQSRRGLDTSPVIYRSLVYAAQSGLRATGHGGDQLLLGELLPFARSGITGTAKLRPLEFLRELACVNAHLRPYSGRAARQRHCQRYRALPGTGLAYHPYTLAGGPDIPTPNRDDASIANLGRVTQLLDALGSRGRFQTRRMPLWISEFGFQTNPPDPYQAPLSRVPQFMGESEWFAYHYARVVSYSQYPLVDDPSSSRSGFSGFHSGLRFRRGSAKPGVYKAWKTPLFVRWISGSEIEFFGGVRGERPGTPVTLESRLGHHKFVSIGTTVLGAHGYFDATLRIGNARRRQYRFTSGRRTSRTANAA